MGGVRGGGVVGEKEVTRLFYTTVPLVENLFRVVKGLKQISR